MFGLDGAPTSGMIAAASPYWQVVAACGFKSQAQIELLAFIFFDGSSAYQPYVTPECFVTSAATHCFGHVQRWPKLQPSRAVGLHKPCQADDVTDFCLYDTA
jgi:hypothetical protein